MLLFPDQIANFDDFRKVYSRPTLYAICLIFIVQTLTADQCHSEALFLFISVNSDDTVPSTACTVLFS